MNRTDPRRDDWIQRARDADLLLTARRHGANLKRAGKEYVGPCPFCGGRDRFSINPVRSLWHCRGHGGGYNAVAMVQHIASMSFLQAVQDITGEPPPDGPARPLSAAEMTERERRKQAGENKRRALEAAEAREQAATKDNALRIWNACGDLAGSKAEDYLRLRGFEGAPGDDVLRSHTALPYPMKGTYDALVCRVDDMSGDLCAVWRIFLRGDARKADVPNAKLGLGPAGGGAVRIGGMAEKIGIAEGVESALGAWHLTGKKHPVWAALSTAGMIGFEVPLGVKHVVVFPDGDRPLKKQGHEYIAAQPAGRKAAEALRARLLTEGVGVTIAAEPGPGRDYNDLWRMELQEDA